MLISTNNNMIRYTLYSNSLIALGLILLLSCSVPKVTNEQKSLGEIALIPQPSAIASTVGTYPIGNHLFITIDSSNTSDVIKEQLQFTLSSSGSKAFKVNFAKDPSLQKERYKLSINQNGVTILAKDNTGWYWGTQTLRQLIMLGSSANSIPFLTIDDYPAFGYRGMMLDIARHFFSVTEIKKLIDDITLYKINKLHLHLSDDQGWRIEIKSWPNLTAIGSKMEVGGSEGGYLSQADYIDLVSYAATRKIMIIPEIDMPGHTNAALASYAQLNYEGIAPELYTGTEVGFSTLSTDKPITYELVDDVVREISALTPGDYFHIGGDESHVTEKDDYIYFVNRVKTIVNSYGKKMIGWDEIAQAKLDCTAVVQLWAHAENAELGIQKGAKVLLSPAHKTYLDMKYDSSTTLGLSWAGYIDLETAYNWTISEVAPGIDRTHIIGLEAPLWTETVTDIKEAEYMIFPRLPAYAEWGWTDVEQRNFERFSKRIDVHKTIWNKLGINYGPTQKEE
ncbi:MAG: hexosaminidase [Cyclobacteriaceae bacterium]|jgi:hexosaminidase